VVDPQEAEAALFPERVGDRLRAARVKAGLDLSDIATKTRVPLRHLQAIEAGDFSSFPSPTYCVGFVKAYARAIGEDEQEFSHALRIELGDTRLDRRQAYYDAEGADPARLPSRTLAWTAAAAALLLAIGYGVWRTQLMDSPQVTEAEQVTPPAPPPTDMSVPTAPEASPTSTPSPTGAVVLTAREPVWIRVYDSADKVLFEKEMTAGEGYTVPADASNPRIRTGRAELLAVTIDGREVAPLGPPDRTIKDVGVSAAALAARPADTTPLAPTATTPVASAQP
jgi:cytoskeleton protein RodZ